MAQVLRQNTLTDQNARPIAGANIYVYDNTGVPAVLTSDGTTPLSQPVITDTFGNYKYYANTGVYTEDLFLGTRRIWEQVIAIGTGADVSTLAALSASGGSALVGFKASGTGAVTRTLQNKVGETQVSVMDYGAKGDGVTDDTAAFNNAIAAIASTGGNVWAPVTKYLIAGQVSPSAGVSLKGMATGPFDNTSNPSTTIIAPTLLITNTTTPAINLSGQCSKISDFLFWWPNQVAVSAATPTVYPFAIVIGNGDASNSVERCTLGNAYNGIDIESGRSRVSDCLLGCFKNDIKIDNAKDWVELHNVKCQIMWDVFAGSLALGQPIDTWVMNNSIALLTGRVDSLQATNFSVFGRYVGHSSALNSSYPAGSQSGYGRFSNVDFDYVAYGITANGSNATALGFKYENMDIAANASGIGTTGQAAIITNTGAAAGDKPYIAWANGSIRGTWAAGALPTTQNDGKIYVGESVRGFRPYGAVTAPVLPASGSPVTNNFPFPVNVHLEGGTITGVTVGTQNMGTTRDFILSPGIAFTPTYSVAPTMMWNGL